MPIQQPAHAWERLEQLVRLCQRGGLRSLSGDELLELGRLYRRAAAALSFARSQPLPNSEHQRLNALVARAYGQLYRTARKPAGSLRQFLRHDFPASFRLNWPFFAAAVLVLLVGAVVGGVATAHDEGFADVLFGPGASDLAEHVVERHAAPGPRNWLPDRTRPMASTLVLGNNLMVAGAALGLGILGGVGTLYVLWQNGLLLGVIGQAVHGAGADADFWAFVLPHGVPEMTAVFLAGASGFMLGYSVLFPGSLRRLEAIKLAGRQAVKLLMGAGLLLIPAAIIEAFFSPVPEVPHAIKMAFAALEAGLLYTYLFTAGGSPSPVRELALPREPIACWTALELAARAVPE